MRELNSCLCCVQTSHTVLEADSWGSSGTLTGSKLSQPIFEFTGMMTNHIKFPSGISDERPARKESSKIQLDIAFALLLEKRKLFRENERTNALGTPKGRGGPTAQVRREERTRREAGPIDSFLSKGKNQRVFLCQDQQWLHFNT